MSAPGRARRPPTPAAFSTRARRTAPGNSAKKSIELAIAAAALEESAVRAEAADVLYHLLVLLRARGVTLKSVMEELGKRSAQSGHEEKASRLT